MEQDSIITLIALLCFVALPILGWIVSRLLSHRERMEMIRHGYVPPQTINRVRGFGYDPTLTAHQHLRRGVNLAFIGLALLIGLSFIGYSDGHFFPGPWLLGGLIPLFVGLAQIVGAMMTGGRFSRPFQSGPGFGPSDDLGSSAWREPQESSPPVRPPDTR